MIRDPSFRTVRWMRTFNLLLQAGLVLTFAVGLNYLALHGGWRFDFSAHHRHSLTPETLSYLGNLKEPVKVYIAVKDDDDGLLARAHRDMTDLLEEFSHATEEKLVNASGQITFEIVNIDLQRKLAKDLNLAGRPGETLVQSGSVPALRRRYIGPNELYYIKDKDKDPIPKAFLGEQAVMSAILDVSNPEKKKIYFMVGHDEISPDNVGPEGYSTIKDALLAVNYEVLPLNLRVVPDVPKDAALVVIAGPTNAYLPYEVDHLRHYLSDRAGRLLVLLAPSVSPQSANGLEPLFNDWGILVNKMVVYDNRTEVHLTGGDLLLTPPQKGTHPIIKTMADNSIAVSFGRVGPVQPDLGHPDEPSLIITPLLGTSASAWGTVHPPGPSGQPPLLPMSDDMRGPFAVATAAERASPAVPGGCLVVVGGADWAGNQRVQIGGNYEFFFKSVNWLVGRDVSLSLPLRPIVSLELPLTPVQLNQLWYSIILGLPVAVGLLGMVVFWTRRR